MEYQAQFGINCGVSSGFGLKDSDYVETNEIISAETPEAAFGEAMKYARKFADDYLSDPETGLTTVRLVSLKGPPGNVSFNSKNAVVQRSMLEHILALASEESPSD